MEWFRKAVEQGVFSISGIALGEFDLEQPPGDPGLYGPESLVWQVHGDFTTMLCGGISSLLLQMLHPLALAGVWDHSRFREDMLGRLRRTSQFIAVTTFGNTTDANYLIEKVKRIHSAVTGHDARGAPYAASDPPLLTWVHVSEVSQFLAAYLRYRNPDFSETEQDEYYRQAARVATALGATDVPCSVREVKEYLAQIQPELRFDERTREVAGILLHASPPRRAAWPVARTLMYAGVDLLPPWAQKMGNLTLSPWQRASAQTGVRLTGTLLRWAVRNNAYHRACRRVGKTV